MIAYSRQTDFDGTHLLYLVPLSSSSKLCQVSLILSRQGWEGSWGGVHLSLSKCRMTINACSLKLAQVSCQRVPENCRGPGMYHVLNPCPQWLGNNLQ